MMDGIPCTWMRGGTSKGVYFLKQDLPADIVARDELLLLIMGSPDSRQIDGIGGADPLTSKVAIISKSERDGADVDYLFLQVFIDRPIVTDTQNCGNILAGVGQFSVEQGLVVAQYGQTKISVYLENSDQIAEVTIETPNGIVTYDGETQIDGVPGRAAQVLQNFPGAAGATCGALLPTGNIVDVIDGVEVTCIDNGMPVVILGGNDFGLHGDETREQLDNNHLLKKRLESIRLQAGYLMGLGDVRESSVPKMTLITAPRQQGVINTHTFIPHHCHASIGVLGAVSVATACLLPQSSAGKWVQLPDEEIKEIVIEHLSGQTSVVIDATISDGEIDVRSAAVVRTARKLFEGRVFARSGNVKDNN